MVDGGEEGAAEGVGAGGEGEGYGGVGVVVRCVMRLISRRWSLKEVKVVVVEGWRGQGWTEDVGAEGEGDRSEGG